MLYLDYSRNHGEWEPNIFGGNHNLDSISMFKELNETVYAQFTDVQMIAEESTSFTGVSRPIYTGGLGFGQKWMMGWMNDTLKYFEKDPMYRKYSQDNLTFSTNYVFTENFMLPFSHDEVVYGKKSMVEKMPGDEWQRFANLRLLYTYMFTHPGTNLMFMGGEFGQTSEWNFEKSLEWWLLDHAPHKGMQDLVKALNNMYKTQPALFDKQFSPEGFEWIDTTDRENSIVVYARKGNDKKEQLIIILNLTPVPRPEYRIGVPLAGIWTEVLNSDDTAFYGSGKVNNSAIITEEIAWHGKAYSICLTIPPLGAVVLKLK
jgi:1,4-alpha-glucan branching enzyme